MLAPIQPNKDPVLYLCQTGPARPNRRCPACLRLLVASRRLRLALLRVAPSCQHTQSNEVKIHSSFVDTPKEDAVVEGSKALWMRISRIAVASLSFDVQDPRTKNAEEHMLS